MWKGGKVGVTKTNNTQMLSRGRKGGRIKRNWRTKEVAG